MFDNQSYIYDSIPVDRYRTALRYIVGFFGMYNLVQFIDALVNKLNPGDLNLVQVPWGTKREGILWATIARVARVA